MNNKKSWTRYLFEFLTIFFSVTLAFYLAKMNENSNRAESYDKTLMEIRNGLDLDLHDIGLNIKGHQGGIAACKFFRKYLNGQDINQDSIYHYHRYMIANFISIQNKSGYESLKAKGLEIVSNDSLRLKIISLYDVSYEIIEKLEDGPREYILYHDYFAEWSRSVAGYMEFNEKGHLIKLAPPDKLDQKSKNVLLNYLWKIESNRRNLIHNYEDTITAIKALIEDIDRIRG